MKKIAINISHAKIESFSVELSGEFPTVSATIWLYTENEKKISTYSVSNRKYYWEDIDFPPEIYDWLYRMLDVIEWVVTRNAQSKIGLLESRKKVSKKEEKPEDLDLPF